MGCGNNFCVIVTDNCKTYSWGINMSGELGLGIPTLDEVSYVVKPCEIVEFSGKTIGNSLQNIPKDVYIKNL